MRASASASFPLPKLLKCPINAHLLPSLAGCYVPCDPGYPDDRLAIYLEDGGASILLTSRDLMVRAENLMPTGRSLQVRWEARVGKADQFGHSSRATHLPAFLAGVCHRL